MRLRTLPNVRLVCTLHCSSLMRAGFGAKPDEYMRVLRLVSNTCGSRLAWALANAGFPDVKLSNRRSIGAFPQVRGSFIPVEKIALNLWILWKTQDSRLWNLWITWLSPLFVHRLLAIIDRTRRTHDLPPAYLDICHLAPNICRSSPLRPRNCRLHEVGAFLGVEGSERSGGSFHNPRSALPMFPQVDGKLLQQTPTRSSHLPLGGSAAESDFPQMWKPLWITVKRPRGMNGRIGPRLKDRR